MSRLPGSRTTIWALRLVREERPQRLADLALVVVEQEVVPRLVADHPVLGGIAFTRSSVSADDWRCGPPCPPRVGSRSVAPSRIWAATPSTTFPDGGQHEVVGELQRGERGDDAEDLVAALLLDLGLDRPPTASTASGVKRSASVLALAQGDERDHRLAAEQVLVGDAVLVDVLVLVEVAVLAGGELELGDAEAEHDRDQQPDDRHDAGALAEVEAEPGPVLLHAGSSRRRCGGVRQHVTQAAGGLSDGR